MKNRSILSVVLFFLILPFSSIATHIVGGSITYVYNGGSSYTVTLKLYRDCGPGTAQFPDPVTISVAGYNGASFSPSKDIIIPLGTTTQVPSNLDSCANAPNPMPCTQEGIYTTTVNNLPPNPGGYHLYFQVVARNLSLTNVNASGNNIGESFYAYIPGPPVLWGEDFPQGNGTTIDNGPTAWTTSAGTIAPASASVNTKLFQITGANDAQQTWTSQVIPIGAFASGVNLRVDLSENGTLDPNDSINVYYSLNGGPLIRFSTNGFIVDDFANAVASENGLIGATIQIIIQVHFDANSPNTEIYRFDNVLVSGTSFINNSNPAFNLLPPLFLCVNQPFTFNHSASDIDGDSLSYSFYTPFNGDNGPGTLDPTFPNNNATFQPVTFLPGFSTNNPLGGVPLNLNVNSGLLTGTPSSLGQFVVGIRVKEFRNGVLISSTFRDFQFNVINCPQFAPAILSPISSCNNNTITFTNLGGSSGSNWLWNFGDPSTTNDNSTLNNPTYTYPNPGTYTVSLTTGVGTSCANTATTQMVVSSVIPNFTSNSPQCVGNTINFTDITTHSANTTLNSWKWSFGDGSFSNLQNPIHTYANSGTFQVTLVVGSSTACSDTIVLPVIVNALPISNAGGNQTVCGNNASVALSGSVSNATGGIWSTSGSGNFVPNATTLSAIYLPSIADTLNGSVVLTLTTTGNGTCPAVLSNKIITFSQAPTPANAGPDQLVCGTTTATLAGNTPSVGTGLWTIVSGNATIVNPTSPTTLISGLVPGLSVILKWTISSPLCLSNSDLVTISTDLLPTTANAGPDKILCSTTNTQMFANAAVVGLGQWSIISGIANIVSPNSNTSSITGLLANSTVVLRWTIKQGLCESFDDISIRVNEIAIVDAGSNQSLCAPANIQLNGIISGGSNSGIWTTLGSGTFTPNATTLNAAYVLSNADVLSGSVMLVLTSTGNTPSCPAVSDTIKINFTGFNGIINVVPTNVSCFGGSNGVATALVTGGIPPFSYFWNNVPAQTSSTISNLSQGNYTVTVTDGNGCSKTEPFSISQPAQLFGTGSLVDASCFGLSNGSVSLSVSGGTSPFSFQWIPGGQTSSSIINLSAGNYSVNIKDANNCQQNLSFTVQQPAPLTVALLSANVDCFGGSNGSIGSTVNGGTTPYAYNWNPNGATTPSIAGLTSGNYSLIVTDSKGCTATSSANLIQNSSISIPIVKTDETCSQLNNGTASVNPSGGAPGYNFLWNPGNLSTSSISNLASGTYTLIVTDSKGCAAIDFVTIQEPSPLTANFINQQDVTCFNTSTGSATVNAGGGTPNYSYFWVPGNFTTSSINNLTAGTYTVTVSDNNNCQTQNSVVITQPSQALAVTSTSIQASCNGGNNGSVTANPIGGTPPYQFLWTPGNFTSQTVFGLTKGNYSVTVTDSKGCSSISSATVTEPLAISATTGSANSNCGLANGIAFVNVSGGVAPFSYQWSPAGGNNDTAFNLLSGLYSVLITDGNGCSSSSLVNVNDNNGPSVSIIGVTNVTCFGGTNGSATASVASGAGPFTFNWLPSGGSGPIATGLSAGIYTVVVTDANGCNSLATISPAITQPNPLSIHISTSDVTCFGGNNGSASATVSGGTPGYQFIWSPVGGAGSSAVNLPSANYTLLVTDAKNCTSSSNFSIDAPTQIVSSVASVTDVSCFGGNNGTASVSVIGGSPVYAYSWSPAGGNGPTASNLAAGNYIVDILDSKGCPNTATVNIGQPAQPLSATSNGGSVSCFGASNGTAQVSAFGGTPGYTYLWLPFGGTNPTATGLTPGNYFVRITDANNCNSNVAVAVAQATQLQVGLSPINASCGLSNGIINSQVSGGTAPYTYLWTPTNATSSNLSNAAAGAYSLQVTDAKNCSFSTQTSIANNSGPTVNLGIVSGVSCAGGTNGLASIQITQGTAPFSINWSPSGGNNLVAQNLSAGNYTATVVDANGCQATVNTSIPEPLPLSISVVSATDVSCNGGSDGTVTVVASGGNPNYTYSWSPVISSSATVSNLSQGNYVVTTFDQNLCTSSISVNVKQPTSLSSSIGSVVNPICFGGTGTATVFGIGGSFPYSYLWATNPPQTGSTASSMPAGSTLVTISDAKGCTTTDTAFLSQPSQVITSGGPDVSLCSGQSSVITANASGGGGIYFYSWLPNGVINSGSLLVSPPQSSTFVVFATDQNGCSGTRDSINAVVFTLPASSVQLNGTTPICPGQSSLLIAEASGTTGPLSYFWNNNLGVNDSLLVTPTQPSTFTVTIVNSCGVAVTKTILIDFNPPPNIFIQPSITDGCIPMFTNFTDASVSGNSSDPISSWLWNFGDGTTSNLQNPNHTYSQPGTYPVSLTVTTNNGCTNNNLTSALNVTAHPIPVAAFSLSSNTLSLPADVLNCTNQSMGASNYLWLFGDGGSSSLENPSYNYTLIGNFTVQLISKNDFGCADTTSAEVSTSTNIIFPNAFTPNAANASGGYYNSESLDNDIFFPYTTGVVDFKLQIFNRWGELIFESSDIKQGWDGYYRGKLCPADVYIWKARLVFNNGQLITKAGDVTLLR